ncbi:MAG TPA: hypothetical protein VMH92_06185 [Acidocella sp.]|nr:hypothetical protein [Acidocella sp.]
MLKPSILIAACALACFVAVAHPAGAQTSSAPVVATCKDGSSFTGQSRKGACKGHGGVAAFESATPAPAPAPAASNSMGMSPSTPAKPATAPMAAGGGAGKVWVNTASKVYHCPGDRYYGKTKQGEYMTESAAIAAGDKADHGKACK